MSASPVSKLTCSPTADLVAVITNAGNGTWVYIWRTNGDLVYNINLPYHQQANAVCWKPDGQFLAIGWDDGFVRLVGLESRKAVHQIYVTEKDDISICCIAWASNWIINSRLSDHCRSIPRITHLVGSTALFNQDGDVADKDINEVTLTPNFLEEIGCLDFETVLPKLSALPMEGGSGEDMFVFTTQSSLNSVFAPFSPTADQSIDILVVGTTDGKIHLSVSGSFLIGNFPLPSALLGISGSLNLYRHAYHRDIPIHALLLKPSELSQDSVVLLPLDLRSVLSSNDLAILASKTTNLRNHLRYLHQTQIHMCQHWQSTRDLPQRFLRVLREDLAVSKKTVTGSLYHSVLTGHVPRLVKEWLISVVAERGHKRWNKAVTEGLHSLRNLIHENFLPCLDHLGIVLSRLKGLACFEDTSAISVGFSELDISFLLEITSGLSLIGNRLLLMVMEEIDLFPSFSTWIRFEIDKLSSSNSVSVEICEREGELNAGKISAYIDRYLEASPISAFLGQVTGSQHTASADSILKSSMGPLHLLGEDLELFASGQTNSFTRLQVKFLVDFLGERTNALLGSIASAQKQAIHFGPPTGIRLPGPVRSLDLRLIQSLSPVANEAISYVSVVSEQSPYEVYIFRSKYEYTSGILPSPKNSYTGLSLGAGRIIDLGFLDDTTLLLLWSYPPRLMALLKIPFTSPDLKFSRNLPDIYPRISHQIDASRAVQIFDGINLGTLDGFEPCNMEVRPGSHKKGKIPARVCLLGRDKCTYRVYGIPGTHEVV